MSRHGVETRKDEDFRTAHLKFICRPLESRLPQVLHFSLPAIGFSTDAYELPVLADIGSIEMLLSYFDPGAGTLLLQVLIGGFAGVMVFGKMIWNQVVGRFRSPSKDN